MFNTRFLAPCGTRGLSLFVLGLILCFTFSWLVGCGPIGSLGGAKASTDASISNPARRAPAKQRQAFQAAETLHNNGQHAEALQAFKDFVQRFPSSALADRALMALGDLSLQSDQPIQAQGYYRNLTQRFPSSPLAPEALLQLGILAYDMQDYSESQSSLRLALNGLTIPQQQAQAHYYLGLNARQQQRYVEAFEAFNQAVQGSTDEALIRDAQSEADALLQNDLTLEDTLFLVDRYATASLGAQLLIRLAEHQREARDIMGEMETLQRLLTTFPDHPDLALYQARLELLDATMTTDATKIGVLLPLSGVGQQFGENVLRGIQLALDLARSQHPELNLDIRTRDTQGDSAVAAEALHALVTEDHVIAVIGPLLSDVATDLAPLTEELGIPVISPYARDSEFPFLSPYAFRNNLTAADQARRIARHAVLNLNLTRFAVLYPEDSYGVSLKDRFIEQIIALDGEVVAVSDYPPDSNTFGAAIKRLGGIDDQSLDDLLVGSGPKTSLARTKAFDAIFIPGYHRRIGLIAPELAFYNITNVQLLGNDGWNSDDLIIIGEDFVEGAVFVDGFFNDAKSRSVTTFVQQYLDTYQERPTLLAALGYDTLDLLREHLQSGILTRFELRDQLLEVRGFPGVTGPTDIDQDGNAVRTPYLLTVKEGSIQLEKDAFEN